MQKQKAVDGTVNDFGSNHMITLWDGICKAWKGLMLSEVEWQKVPKCWKGKLPMKINGCPAIKKPNLIWHSFSKTDRICWKTSGLAFSSNGSNLSLLNIEQIRTF